LITCDLTKNFTNATRRFHNRVAIQAKLRDTWQRLSYTELDKKVKELSYFLSSLAIKKSDRIAIILENRLEWPIIFFAISYVGAAAVPIDFRLPQKEIASILSDSGARFVFISEENVELTGFLKTFSQIEKIITVPFKAFQDAPESFVPADMDPDDLAVFLYTSGTTQEPKGVMLTHKNLCSNFNSVNKLRLFTSRDSILAILPLFHTYALMTTLIIPLFSGLKIIYVPRDWPERLAQYIKESRASILIGVPQMFSAMHSRMMKKINELTFILKPFTNLLIKKAFGKARLFISGGAKLDETVCRDFLRLGLKILEGYGLTETSPVLSINPFKKPKPGSCGKPVPDVEIEIMNKNADGIGEIVAKGPNIMKGYYKDEQKTKSAFKDGWFLTGDLGYIDSEGYIHIVGRLKEVIVLSSGKNIFPEEIERHYSKDPCIKEMCVMGVLKQKGTAKIEYLHAVILPDVDFLKGYGEKDIREAIKARFESLSKELPAYKRIMGFTVIKDSLPRTVLGKIKRYEVQKKFMPIISGSGEKGEEVLSDEDRALAETETAKKVIKCVKEALEIKSPVRLNDSIELDLGVDSLAMVELVCAIEKEFNIELDEKVVSSGISTVKDIILTVKELTEP